MGVIRSARIWKFLGSKTTCHGHPMRPSRFVALRVTGSRRLLLHGIGCTGASNCTTWVAGDHSIILRPTRLLESGCLDIIAHGLCAAFLRCFMTPDSSLHQSRRSVVPYPRRTTWFGSHSTPLENPLRSAVGPKGVSQEDCRTSELTICLLSLGESRGIHTVSGREAVA
jgi:hypothetical protein